MTTETMTFFSLEEGDTILIQDSPYFIREISPTDSGYRLTLVDEEGMLKALEADVTTRVKVVIQ